MLRSAEAAGLTPIEQADRTSARFRETWDLLDISLRRLHPHHRAPPRRGGAGPAAGRLRQRPHLQGHLQRPVLRVLRGLLHRGRAGRRPHCPIHHRPVEHLEEENWFFRLSAFAQPLLDWYAAHPDAVAPEGKRNEALGIIRQGLDDISISRTSIDWGVPVPWDPDHVFYVWYDALINYATAVGYGDDPERFAAWWPAVHHLIGKDILRFHCVYWPAMLLAAGLEPPAPRERARLPAGGRREDEQDRPEPDLPGRSGRRLRRRRLPLPLPARRARSAPTATSPTRAWSPATTPTWPTTWATCCRASPPWWPAKCDGIGPAPRPDSPLAAVAAEVYADAAAAWAGGGSPSVALEATWRLLRETNAHLEANEPWKAEPGPEVDGVLGDALEALRIVAVLATPAIPRACAELWRRIGLPGAPADQRLPEAAAWGGYPGGPAGREGRAAVPAARHPLVTDAAVRDGGVRVRWPLDRQPLPPAGRRGRRHRGGRRPVPPASTRLITVGTDAEHSRQAIDVARRHEGVWATAGRPPPRRHRAGVERPRGPARPSPRWWPWGSAGSTTTTTTRPATSSGRVFAAQVALAHAHDLALVIHTREAWADTFDILERRGRAGPHGVPLLHRRTRRGAARPRPRHAPVVQRHRHLQDRRRRPGRRRALPARPAAGRDRLAVSRPGAAPRPAQPAGARARSSGEAVAGVKGVDAGGGGRGELGDGRALYRLA